MLVPVSDKVYRKNKSNECEYILFSLEWEYLSFFMQENIFILKVKF